MNGSVVQRLIVKDWDLNRMTVGMTILGGALALTVFQLGNLLGWGFGKLAGLIAFFVTLIILACMLPMASIIGERKKQTLAFVMSLPVSAVDYTAAKILSSVGVFIVPWLILAISAVAVIVGRSDIPNGLVPMALILTTLPLLAFCLITCVAIFSESEGWTIAATIFCNVGYTFAWIDIVQTPALMRDLASPVPIWNTAVVTLLASEFALIALIFTLTFYLQSRKRDFV